MQGGVGGGGAGDGEPPETAAQSLGPTQPHDLTASPTHRSAPDPHTISPGVLLDGRYRLEQMLGRGATAEVYRGTDQLLGRPVAVKVFHQGIGDSTSAARQRTEMQVLAKLHHPHLVMVYDAKIGTDPGGPGGHTTGADALSYLVMELVQGGTLADRIKPGGLPPGVVAGIGAAIAGALAAVHRLELVHRDIKPANILMSTAGEAKLSDFGIARELEAERLTAAADVIGTAAYLSPEQARGADVGPPTDVYALGLVLLECLTGRREYPGGAVESATARLLRDPVIPPDIPPPWPGLLRAMTQSQPRLRPTAGAVETALTAPAGTTAAFGGAAATATLPQPYPAIPPVGPPPAAGAAAVGKPPAGVGRIFVIALLTTALIAFALVAVVALVRSDTGGEPSGPAVTSTAPAATSKPSTGGTTVETVTTRTTETTTSSPTSTTTSSSTTSQPTTPTTSEPATPTTPTTPTTATTTTAARSTEPPATSAPAAVTS